MYGVLNFLEQGVYGRWCRGLAALKGWQQERDTQLTAPLQDCFGTIRKLLRLKPQRMVEVVPRPCARFVAASDAAKDTPGTDRGILGCLESPRRLQTCTRPGDHKIAQLRLIMGQRPSEFRGRRGIFLIDNLATLLALIKGRSEAPDLEHLSGIIHGAMFGLQACMYREWVPSNYNWADAISGLGSDDTWYRGNRFSYYRAYFPIPSWHLPLPAVIQTFECL